VPKLTLKSTSVDIYLKQHVKEAMKSSILTDVHRREL